MASILTRIWAPIFNITATVWGLWATARWIRAPVGWRLIWLMGLGLMRLLRAVILLKRSIDLRVRLLK